MKKIIYLFSITFLMLQSCSSENSSNENNNSSTYSFSQGGIITDSDGNSYPTIVTNCSNQVWMQKNLNVSRYRNGDIIPQVTNENQWDNLTTGAWRYYSNSTSNGIIYGKLYNWYAINDPRGIAPLGWHVPTVAEFNTFINCLGGSSVAGGAMKETGTSHWLSPNDGATNSSGFTGLPGGGRWTLEPDTQINRVGHWWTLSPYDGYNAYILRLDYWQFEARITPCGNKAGSSVRCVKD
jgi:uncharacterized protein (TIGR02145 family)